MKFRLKKIIGNPTKYLKVLNLAVRVLLGLTRSEGLRESAEASFGREMMRLQTEFHDLLTQVAEAKDMAGSLVKMLWRRSSLRTLMPVMGSIEDFPLELDRDDDEHGGSSIAVVVRVRLVNAKCGIVAFAVF